MRVLFWGTPEFAAAPLRALIGEGFDVVGVVSQPDKPQGRAREMIPSPVKQIAVDEGIPCFQPETTKDPEFNEMMEVIRPDVSVVVAYGRILSRKLIDLPKLGTFNIHASLLPLLRGASPIQAAIRQGFTQTGVTIMRMVPELDAGPIVLTSSIPILEDETYGELQMRLSELGALTVVEALTLISMGEATETAQDDSLATYSPKITREDARVIWPNGIDDVCRTIRAYDPKPAAFTTLNGLDVKLFGARRMAEPDTAAAPGRVVDVRQGIIVSCGDGLVCIRDVQPAGKSRMRSADWARGRGILTGDTLGT